MMAWIFPGSGDMPAGRTGLERSRGCAAACVSEIGEIVRQVIGLMPNSVPSIDDFRLRHTTLQRPHVERCRTRRGPRRARCVGGHDFRTLRWRKKPLLGRMEQKGTDCGVNPDAAGGLYPLRPAAMNCENSE